MTLTNRISPSEFSIQLLSDKDQTGKQAYYFIKVPGSKLKRFLEVARRNEALDLSEYGEVIYSAYGETPPEHIVKWMSAEHGFQG